ncbi:MAG TPA: NUDIX hydrolase [Flavitalea sp.]|nr:NUDIX hydrolase [Flavitalea sp.]
MHLKIYFQDKPLYLTNSIDKEIEPYVHHDDAIYMDELSNPGINSMIHEMRQKKIHAGVYLNEDLDKLQKAFKKKFVFILAAGGLVFNETTQILVMKRRKKWDLPKGKLDPGESIETCAIREVCEETGLRIVSIESFLLKTYHTYDEGGKHFLKETHWYKMTAPSKQTLQPEEKEQITEVVWLDRGKIPFVLQETYPSIRDVFFAAGFG